MTSFVQFLRLAEIRPAKLQLPRTGVTTVGLWLAYGASFSTPWNGVILGGLRPGDALLLLALMVFLIADAGRVWPTLPAWVWLFAGAILVVTVIHEMWPTDPNYLLQRIVVDGGGQRTIEIQTNLKVGLKFLVPVVGIPLVFAFAHMHERRALLRCAFAYAAGAAVSGLIAFSDVFGITSLAQSITGVPVFDNRGAGLTVHPNFLAMSCVLGLPIALWLLLSPSYRNRVYAGITTVVLLLGIFASGSRGGAAVGAGTALLAVVMLPRYRRLLPVIAFLLACLGAAVFVLQPAVGESLLNALRLTSGDKTATGSDYVRAMVGHQGLEDFWHRPIDGVGMQVAAEAHNVYLQALASGGLLLLTGLVIFLVAALARSLRLIRVDALAAPFFVAAVSVAMLDIVENALTDRLAYVPLALIAAMPATLDRPATLDQPDAPDVPAGASPPVTADRAIG